MTGNLRKVEDFIAAWNRRDRDAILGAFAVDAIYHNIPMTPAVGLAEIEDTIDRLLPSMSDVEWVITAIAETSDGRVLTERTDSFKLNGSPVSLPIMGVFEFEGHGLISRWADYFDLQSYLSQIR